MADPFFQRLDELAQATVPAPAGQTPQLSNTPTDQPQQPPPVSGAVPAPIPPAADTAPAAPTPTAAPQQSFFEQVVAAQPQRDPLQELDRVAALNDPNRDTAFYRGLQRGIGNFQQIVPHAQAIYHDLTGDEAAAQASMAEAQQIENAGPTALMPDLRDIHGWRDFTVWLAEKLGEQVPNVAAAMTGGGIGALTGRAAARGFMSSASTNALARAEAVGGFTGAAIPNVAVETSGTLGELHQATGQMHTGVAAGAGAIKGVLETLTPFALGKLVGVIPGISALRMSSIPGAALSAAGLEAGTEISQEAVDMAARWYVDPNYNPFDAEGVWRLLNAGAAGGAVGGVAGGAGRAFAGRSPHGFSQQVPPATVAAAQASGQTKQENGAPSPLPTTAAVAPLQQATNAVNDELLLHQVQAARSPIPSMYREVLGRKRSTAPQTQLLSDGGPSEAGPVLAGEAAQQARQYRASVLTDADAVLGERALPRYRVIRKDTGETVGGIASEALTPRAVEEAMAVAGSQNVKLERVDYSKMDRRAITASVEDLPTSIADSRVYFVAGTTPAQITAATEAFRKMIPLGPAGKNSAQTQEILQNNKMQYAQALQYGMRVLPRYGDSFLYLGQMTTVPTTERPPTTRAIERRTELKPDGSVQLVSRSEDLRTLPEGEQPFAGNYRSYDLAQIPGADPAAVGDIRLRAKIGDIRSAEVLSPYMFPRSITDMTRARLSQMQNIAQNADYKDQQSFPRVIGTPVYTDFGAPAAPPGFNKAAHELRLPIERFVKAVMHKAGLKIPVVVTWQTNTQVDSPYHQISFDQGDTNSYYHHIALYASSPYTEMAAAGVDPKVAILDILKHELGHALTLDSFIRLPAALRQEVLASWQQARLFTEMERGGAASVSGMPQVTPNGLSTVMPEQRATVSYHLSLTEWWAEQARRWMDSEPSLVIAQQQIFKELAKNFELLIAQSKQTFGETSYRVYQAEKPIHWWMEYMRRTATGAVLSENDVKEMIRYRLGVEPRLNDMSYFPKLQGERLHKALADAVEGMLDRMPKDVKLKIDTTETVDGQQTAAMFYPAERLLVLSKAAFENPILLRTLKHEEVHILRDLFTPEEWTTLRDAAADYFKTRPWRPGQQLKQLEASYRRAYTQNYREMFPTATSEEVKAFVDNLIAEEQVAHFLERRQVHGESFGEKLNALLDRIIDFLQQLKNTLLQNGFPTLRQVIHDIESGTIAQRSATQLTFKALDENLKRERMQYVDQAPLYAPGLHIHASELQEISRRAIDVWHGTPHEFAGEVELTYPDGKKRFVPTETKLDAETVKGIKNGSITLGAHPYGRFSLEKIGTGEGAQVYGWGLYFTETESIAKHYKKVLSQNTSFTLLSDNNIKWDKLPGGLTAKPIWQAVFDYERRNAPAGSEVSLKKLFKHINYGGFLALGRDGVTSDYYGHEEAVRKVLETVPAYQEAKKHFDTVLYPTYKKEKAAVDAALATMPREDKERFKLEDKRYFLAYKIDKQRAALYKTALNHFGFTGEYLGSDTTDKVLAAATQNVATGSIYKVQINATDENFILYDKPLSEQPAAVQKALNYNKATAEAAAKADPFTSKVWETDQVGGDNWYRMKFTTPYGANSAFLAYIHPVVGKFFFKSYEVKFHDADTKNWKLMRTFSTEAAAKAYVETELPKTKAYIQEADRLRAYTRDRPVRFVVPKTAAEVQKFVAAGVKGIKYLDGPSRKQGEGRYNYVIFDEGVVSIVERNGQPVSPELHQAALEYFRQRLEHRAAMTGRTRIFGDIRDEALFKPDFVAKVTEGLYVAAEMYNGDNSRNLKQPDLANFYFFNGPRTSRLLGDIEQQLQQLGPQVGHLQLSKRDVGYETDFVHVNPSARGQHLATQFQNYAGKLLKFSPRPSGVLLSPGYNMWQARDPQAVKYYQRTMDGDYVSPKTLQATINRIRPLIEYKTRNGHPIPASLQERYDEAVQLLKRVPPEGLEAAQLAKHYAMADGPALLARVAMEQRDAEERRDEQQMLAATPVLREAAARIQRRMTALDALEQPARSNEIETAPTFRMASMLGKVFNDPNSSPEDKNVSRYLTGTLIPEIDKVTRLGQKFLGLKQLVQRNPHIQGLSDYDILVDQWNTERMNWVAKGDTIMRSWRSLDLGEQQRLGELLFYMTEMEYRTSAEVSAGVTRMPTLAEIVKALRDHKISPDGAAVFDAINTQFTEFLTSLEQTLKVELDQAYTPGTPAHTQAITDLQNDFAGMRSRPYFPFMRHGRHTLTVRDAVTQEVLWFSTYERVSERDSSVAEVARRFPAGTIDMHIGLLPENVSQFQGMPPALLRHIADNMPSISSTQKEWIEQLIYDKSPSQAFKRRMAKRSGTPGFSRDAQRSFATYFQYGGSHLARLIYRRPLQEKVDQVRLDGRRLAAEVRRSMIADYMQEHLDYVMDGSRDAFRLKSLVTLWFLAFSPAAAAANLTQVPMVTWPLLTTHFGQAAGNLALTKAYASHKLRKGKPNPHTISAGYDKVRQQLIDEGYISVGLASELAGYTAGRTALTSMVGTSGDRMLQDFTWAGMKMFQMAETFNREVTTAATYELVLRNPQAQIVTATHARYVVQILALSSKLGITIPEATAFFVIKNVLDQTQFNYSDFARAPFMRAKATQVLMPFVGYLQGALFAFGNNPGRAKMMLAMLLMGGVLALPGADDLDKAIKAVARRVFGRDFSIEKFTRELVGMVTKGTRWDTVAPDVLLHGLGRVGGPQGLLPDSWGVPRFDWSGNISLGRVIPGFNEAMQSLASGRKFTDTVNQVSQQTGGPTYGMFYSMMQFLHSNPFSAEAREWEAAMPRAAKAAARAIRWMAEGVETTKSGAKLPGTEFDLSQWTDRMELLMQAAGFAPTRVRFAWENYALYTELDGWYKAQRSWLYEALDRAHRTNNTAMIEAAMADIRDFNAALQRDNFTSYTITSTQIQNSLRNRTLARSRIENDVARSKTGASTSQAIDELRPNVYDTRRVR